MCGIAGLVSTQELDLEYLRSQEMLLQNRGPDESNYLSFRKMGLQFYFLHTRLSIQDISSRSAQPYSTVDSSSLLVYNGEIYNAGSIFPGQYFASDTQFLFQLLDQRPDLLKLLDGFFAFGFYQAKQDLLYIGRDQFGVKPLYYFKNDSLFAFSSSLRHLSRILRASISINTGYLAQSCHLGYTHGTDTLFNNIKKVQPNSLLRLCLKSFKLAKSSIYETFSHNIAIDRCYNDHDSYKELVLKALEQSVKTQYSNSKRGSSLFLSGGVDSALIAAITSSQQESTSRAVRSFSIISENRDVDESQRIDKLLKFESFRGIESHRFKFENFGISYLANMLAELDYPVLDLSILPTLYLCNLVPAESRVCLSGDGADELFAGYERVWTSLERFKLYNAMPLSKRIRHPKLDKYRLAKNPLELRLLLSGVPVEHLSDCLPSIADSNLLSMLLEYEINFYLPSVLEKVDAASMLNGLEVRVPFLSNNIARIIAMIPINHLSTAKHPKLMVKELLRYYTDENYPFYSKRGFTISPNFYDVVIKYLSKHGYPEIHPDESSIANNKMSCLRLLLLKHWIFKNI